MRIPYLHCRKAKPPANPIGRAWLAGVVMAVFTTAIWAQVDSGSICATNPSDPDCLGDVVYSVDTLIQLPPEGILHYASLTVESGRRLTFSKNTVNTPVFVLASGDVTINGTIYVSAPDEGEPGGAAATGSRGDGNVGDDGVPGVGGPGGFDGGRSGLGADFGGSYASPGGAGLGPGGGGPGTDTSRGLGGGGAGYGGAGASAAGTATGGSIYGQESLLPLVGGSSGGGGAGGSNFTGAGGGGGGGAILIASSGAIHLTGSILADGGTGGRSGNYSYPGHGGAGGGGSGGAIRLVADVISGNGAVYARGGGRGRNENCNYSWCRAGFGAGGRIRMESYTFTHTGATSPARSFGEPGPIFVPNNPTLRIATVGGQAVSTAPTGAGDVAFPEDVAQPVTVTVEGSQIPLGTTVTLAVKGHSGTEISYMTPALDGTLVSSSASVDVTLPQGPSVLEAQASFTLVLAGGGGGTASLQKDGQPLMYQGERIELAEVQVGSDGMFDVVYVTSSKKRIPESEVGPLAHALAHHGG